MEENLQIKVTNHLTGEISEIEITGGDQAANVYTELKASYKALDVALKKILNYIDHYMGQDDTLMLGDGHKVTRQQREVKTWTRDSLRQIGLDDDALDIVSKVNMTLAKEVVLEGIERGDINPNAIKELDRAAEISVSKPFVQVK